MTTATTPERIACGKCGGGCFLVLTRLFLGVTVRCEGERGYGQTCGYEATAPTLAEAFRKLAEPAKKEES